MEYSQVELDSEVHDHIMNYLIRNYHDQVTQESMDAMRENVRMLLDYEEIPLEDDEEVEFVIDEVTSLFVSNLK